MKNTIKFLAILLVLFNLTSCNKKDSPTIEEGNSENYYKVYVDGNLTSEGTSTTQTALLDGTLSLGNNVDFSLYITNVPEIGQTADISYIDWANNVDYVANNGGTVTEPMVKISGDNILTNSAQGYSMYSGTLTRVNRYKITFTGTFREDSLQGAYHDFNGEVVFNIIINTGG